MIAACGSTGLAGWIVRLLRQSKQKKTKKSGWNKNPGFHPGLFGFNPLRGRRDSRFRGNDTSAWVRKRTESIYLPTDYRAWIRIVKRGVLKIPTFWVKNPQHKVGVSLPKSKKVSDTQEHKVSDTFFAGRRIDFAGPGFYDDGETGVLRDGFVEFDGDRPGETMRQRWMAG